MNVLVLNASYEPLQRVDLRHAIRMLVREVAVVEEAEEGRTFGRFPVPRVLRLVRYVAMRWRHGRRPPWSKRGVYLRDRGRCCYCGGRGNTIDHVRPQSRGGGDTWENTGAREFVRVALHDAPGLGQGAGPPDGGPAPWASRTMCPVSVTLA